MVQLDRDGWRKLIAVIESTIPSQDSESAKIVVEARTSIDLTHRDRVVFPATIRVKLFELFESTRQILTTELVKLEAEHTECIRRGFEQFTSDEEYKLALRTMSRNYNLIVEKCDQLKLFSYAVGVFFFMANPNR